MPNRLSPSSMAASLACETGFSTIENSPEAPVKSRRPQRVSGIGGKGGVNHARDLGPLRQPARKLEPRRLMPLKPHAEAAQAPQAEIDILGPGAEPEILMRLGNRPEQPAPLSVMAPSMASAWPTMIFGGGLDRHIDAVGERLEVERRRPGVVQDHDRAGRHARLWRWPACPAPRRSASRATRRTRPASCW